METNTAEVVTQIPWAAVITAFAGLSGALGGSFLTNLFAEKRWDKQVKSESEKESRRLMREKGEQAFFAMTKWNKEIYFFYSARLGYLQGSISEELLDKVIREKINTSTHGEVDVLVKLYFPEFKNDVEAIFEKLDKCNKTFGLSESGKITKANALEKMIPLVKDVEESMEQLLDKFSEWITTKMR
ncbi:TPA: hypothetical protein JG874_001698 [Enterobacter hormaechei subsp. steigerwaltii]|nr:hypothetical protein [Enterobacter hormaechei subsp. steigerwaltii]